jgi:hypothetical protein
MTNATRFERAGLAMLMAALAGCGQRSLDVGRPAASGAAGSAVAGMTTSAGSAGVTGAAGASAAGAGGAPLIRGAEATRADGTCVMNAFKRNGVCACEEDLPNVCGDACVDRAHDPDNCGACGHACPATSTCNAGSCGPSVTNVVPAAPGCGSLELAVADGVLYWTDHDHGTVESLRLGSTAAPTTIATNEKGPGLIVVSGSNLFWIDGSVLRQASVFGGAPADIASETNTSGGIRGLAVSDDGRTVYYSAGTKVKSVPVGGGAAIDVGQELRGGLPTALGIEGGTIGYVADLNGTVDVIATKRGAVASCGDFDPTTGDVIGVDCMRLGGCTPEAFLQRFFVRDGQAYWGNGPDVHVGPADVAQGPRALWQPVTSTLLGGSITGLAMSPDAIYFAETPDSYPPAPTAGLIERSPLAPGSTAVAIARGQQGPGAMAVDATNVYWATSDCAINTIAR